MPISVLFPEALLAGLLLLVLYWRFVKNKNAWRTAMVILAVLLLAYPSIVVRSRSLDIFVLADRSRSISQEGIAKENELLELVSQKLEPGDRISVVSFNEQGYVEQVPSPGPVKREFTNPHSVDSSDMTDGLATVLSLVSKERQSRLLVMSDGEYTGQDPTQQTQIARQMNLPIFVRDLKRTNVENLFVAGADTDEKLMAGEPFRVLFRVNSTVEMPGRYRVFRDDRIVGEDVNGGWRDYQFRAGENRIAFSDNVIVTGIHGYRIAVETTPAGREKITSDNEGEKFVSIVGERPVLVVNNDGQPDNITRVLGAGGIPLHLVAIAKYRMNINQLSGYKGVILNNVPLTALPKSEIDDLRNFVVQEGGGLLICGGNRSFGAGGYYRSALEDVMPVSLEDRRQNKKISGAFCFVLDRSGSMAMTVPSGQTKMELADAAAVEALNLLNAGDSISVIAVDSSAHIFVNQQPANNTGEIAAKIRSIESMGGGIFVYTGLVAAGTQIATAQQANKHVLLFADAADAEEPGDYKVLLRKFTEAGVSVSVVGLGTESDPDADFLKDVARLGGGNAYFTQDPDQLVQFFTADTIQYTRKNFIEDPAPMKILPGAFTMSAEQTWKDFSSADYNLLFPREGAEVAIATANGDDSPVLAFWQRGVGRAATLALDAGSDFSSKDDFPDIVLSSARWIMGSTVNDSFQVQSRADGNYARITMEVSDEERAAMGEAKLTMFAPDGREIERPLQWDTWNRLSADVRLNETGAWRGIIQVGSQSYRVGPVSMPVSPEFAWRGDETSGRDVLLQMAAATGGKELPNIAPLFDRHLKTISRKPMILPLLILMMLALLGEIAEARFGWLERLTGWLRLKLGHVRKPVTAGDESASGWNAGFKSRQKPKLKTAGERRWDESASAEKRPVPDKSAGLQPDKIKKTEIPAAATEMDYLTNVKAKARRSMKGKQPPK